MITDTRFFLRYSLKWLKLIAGCIKIAIIVWYIYICYRNAYGTVYSNFNIYFDS